MAVAEELLRTEGFTDISSTITPPGVESSRRIGAGEADLGLNFSAPLILSLEAGNPVVVLAGIHIGCMEVVASPRIQTIGDLKGKKVGAGPPGSIARAFLVSMLVYIGLDPAKDIEWVVQHPKKYVELLAAGQIDALVAFPPLAQELRARKIGRVVTVTTTDRPWSQYFCCMVEGNRAFVQRHPVATKRVLRAVLKATSLCAVEPEPAARVVVARRPWASYEYTVQALKEIPYAQWRSYDPEDTLRFYALRLHDAGMIRSSPDALIDRGTDWRFLTALKQELKG